MKLNLKEALIRFNILQEGWMESLSNKYDEDILIFVGRMLQQAYPNKDVSNHPLAEWIAKEAKSLGEMPWKEPHKTRNEQSFQDILNFIKEKDDAKDVVNRIKSMSAISALDYIKKEIKNETKEEKELNGEEELREWLDKGLMKIIGRGPKGSFWVKPLKVEFFDVAQCGVGAKTSQTHGEFGIGCQRISDHSGGGAVGFARSWNKSGEVYSLLTKSDNGYYTTIISFGVNPENNHFVGDTGQFKNKQIGSEPALGWEEKEILNAFVDFLIDNPYGRKVYKGSQFQPSSRAFGALLKKENKEILYKLLRSRPEILEHYEQQLKQSLVGLYMKDNKDATKEEAEAKIDEEFELLKIGARELYEKDPKNFMENLPNYLKSEKEEALRILSEINFESFIRQYGEDVVLKNIEDILSSMDYNQFQTLIKPYINYDKFLSNTDKSNIKEIIRDFAEKSKNTKKTFPIIMNIIDSEKDFESLVKNFGKGNVEKGLRAFFQSLATPREYDFKDNYIKNKDGIKAMTKKKMFRLFNGKKARVYKSGKMLLNPETNEVYDENGRVLNFPDDAAKFQYVTNNQGLEDWEADIEPAKWILDYNRIKKLIEYKKEEIVKLLGGGKNGEIGYLELLLINSTPQERAQYLKEEAKKIIDYYNEKFEKGYSEYPGIIRLGSILNYQEEYSHSSSEGSDEYYKERAGLSKAQGRSFLVDSFEGPGRISYIVPKEYINNSNIIYIFDFYKKHYKGKYKAADSFSATIQTLLQSKVSIPELLEMSQKFLDLMYKQNKNGESLIQFLYNLTNIIPESTTLKRFIIRNLIENDIGRKISLQAEGRIDGEGNIVNRGEQTINHFIKAKKGLILNKLKEVKDDNYNPENGDKNLQEQEIRKYIRNLFESNFKRG